MHSDVPLAWTWAHESTHFFASGPVDTDWSIAVPSGDSPPVGLLVWVTERDALRCGGVATDCMVSCEMMMKVNLVDVEGEEVKRGRGQGELGA